MSKCKSFFKKTCKFTNGALRKAQNLIEMSQINMKISGLRSRIKHKFVVIGALTVSKRSGTLKDLNEQQCDEKIEKLCSDVDKLKNKIKKSREELEKVRKQMNDCSCCDGFSCADFDDEDEECDSDDEYSDLKKGEDSSKIRGHENGSRSSSYESDDDSFTSYEAD